MNEHYVNIKVDREERPDVDAVYMQATVAMTGQGGWPMTCVLDHEGSPFFAGTYFPDQPRHGQPSFRQLLEAINDAWTNRSDEVAEASSRIREALARAVELSGGSAFDRGALDDAVEPPRPRLRRGLRWVRQRAEVPAVDGPGVPAPGVDESGDRQGRRGHEHGRPDARRDGRRRHPRPARRRLRALRRRPGAGWCRTSRRCSTTTASCSRSTRAGPRSTTTRTRPGSPAASPTSCSPSWAPTRARSPPRWMPTPRARRAPSTSGRRPSWSTCSGPRTAPGPPSC